MIRPKRVTAIAILFAAALSCASAYETLQGPPETRYWDESRAYNGYTLYGARRTSYLIDMEGRVVHTWPVGTNPRLLDNGNLLDASTDDPSHGAGFVELDWNGNTVWEYHESRDDYEPHHDFVRIFNTNLNAYTTLYIANKTVTHDQAIAAGCDPANGPYTGAQMDAMVFDMAPTALTLRFFSLPTISLVWLKELLPLRELICRKKEIIATIRRGKGRLGQDRVTARIQALAERHTRLQRRFIDERTHMHLVMNADRLSLSEALRIRNRLEDLSINVDRVVVNKVRPGDGAAALAGQIESRRVAFLPLADDALVGLASLQTYAQRQQDALLESLPLHTPTCDRRRAVGSA